MKMKMKLVYSEAFGQNVFSDKLQVHGRSFTNRGKDHEDQRQGLRFCCLGDQETIAIRSF